MNAPLNFDNYVFRASMCGDLMTDARDGNNLEKYNDKVKEFEDFKEKQGTKITELSLKLSESKNKETASYKKDAESLKSTNKNSYLNLKNMVPNLSN